MTTRTSNLRFLLSLGNTKIVVLKEENNLHIYTNQPTEKPLHENIATERVAEALLSK